jgi:hypothetical protein
LAIVSGAMLRPSLSTLVTVVSASGIATSGVSTSLQSRDVTSTNACSLVLTVTFGK